MRTHAPTRRSLEPRVPDTVARQIFERLNRDGMLEVVINVLLDRYDHLSLRAQRGLSAEILTDAKGLAVFNARQGALEEDLDIVKLFRNLGTRQPAPQDIERE